MRASERRDPGVAFSAGNEMHSSMGRLSAYWTKWWAENGDRVRAGRRQKRQTRREEYPGAPLPSVADAVAAGILCPECRSAAPEAGLRRCRGCLAERADTHARDYEARKGAGLCVRCGEGPAAPGRVACSGCLADMKARSRANYERRTETGRCLRCGGARDRGSYCYDCRGEMDALAGARRAALAGVMSETVDRLAVFARDGWRCAICGRPTPASRIGTKHGTAPELDHRVPISKGGAHTYENVQCACRRCNLKKGNRSSAGQVPIWARLEVVS